MRINRTKLQGGMSKRVPAAASLPDFLLRHSLRMAVRALHPVDVVLAVRRSNVVSIFSTSSPQFDILGWHEAHEALVFWPCCCVARQATDAFVNSDSRCGRRRCPPAWWPSGRGTGSRAPAAGLCSSFTGRLPSIIAGIGRSASGTYCCVRRSKNASDGRAISCAGPATAAFDPGLPHRLALPVQLVARDARHGRPVGQLRPDELPRTVAVSRACTRSPMPPSKCMPWQRRQSSISRLSVLCFLSRKMRA